MAYVLLAVFISIIVHYWIKDGERFEWERRLENLERDAEKMRREKELINKELCNNCGYTAEDTEDLMKHAKTKHPDGY